MAYVEGPCYHPQAETSAQLPLGVGKQNEIIKGDFMGVISVS